MFLKPTLIAASIAALAAISVPQMAAATASIFSGASGASAACKAAAGPGAQVFYFDTLGALNTSAGTQYLTCNIPDVGIGATGASNSTDGSISEMDLYYSNPSAAPKTFTCVFQAVSFGASTTSAVYTFTAGANVIGTRSIYTSSGIVPLPPRMDSSVYIMSCAIPAGARLDAIKAYYPVPA